MLIGDIKGYTRSLDYSSNELQMRGIAAFYLHLRRVTRRRISVLSKGITNLLPACLDGCVMTGHHLQNT